MIYFDDSLSTLVESVVRRLGEESLRDGVVLRDASGRLAFFANAELPTDTIHELSASLREDLGPYGRPDRIVVDAASMGASEVLTDPTVVLRQVGSRCVRYVDRRLIGGDWLVDPAPDDAKPPRIVFASLKGGVGRSTALCVAAVDQARQGRNVLIVDLDLEAPGIGTLLLSKDRQPSYGSVDYLVERSLRPIDPSELAAFVGASDLTDGGGLVDVVPVIGMRTRERPIDYLSKLSRAMIEDIDVDGHAVSLRSKLRALVDAFSARRDYDIVLVDSRAGMTELAAGSILGLGATVLLFGAAQQQTLDGYELLFSQLSTLGRKREASPWGALKMVHSKALDKESQVRFRDEMWELFSTYLYEELEDFEGFNFDVSNPEAPHSPIVIPAEARFVDWEPIMHRDRLSREYYHPTFGTFLSFVDSVATVGSGIVG